MTVLQMQQCSVCSREFSVTTLPIHERACLKRREIERTWLPDSSSGGGNTAAPQTHASYSQRYSSGQDSGAKENAGASSYKATKVPCPYCFQYLVADGLVSHLRECRPGSKKASTPSTTQQPQQQQQQQPPVLTQGYTNPYSRHQDRYEPEPEVHDQHVYEEEDDGYDYDQGNQDEYEVDQEGQGQGQDYGSYAQQYQQQLYQKQDHGYAYGNDGDVNGYDDDEYYQQEEADAAEEAEALRQQEEERMEEQRRMERERVQEQQREYDQLRREKQREKVEAEKKKLNQRRQQQQQQQQQEAEREQSPAISSGSTGRSTSGKRSSGTSASAASGGGGGVANRLSSLAQAAQADREPCEHCGRKFATDRLDKHQQVCQRVAAGSARRKVFNSFAKRVKGSDLESYIKAGGKVDAAAPNRYAPSALSPKVSASTGNGPSQRPASASTKPPVNRRSSGVGLRQAATQNKTAANRDRDSTTNANGVARSTVSALKRQTSSGSASTTGGASASASAGGGGGAYDASEYDGAVDAARAASTPSSVRRSSSGGHLAKMSKNAQADRVQCPYCERHFSPGTAERHIPKCKDIVNRPKKPAPNAPTPSMQRKSMPLAGSNNVNRRQSLTNASSNQMGGGDFGYDGNYGDENMYQADNSNGVAVKFCTNCGEQFPTPKYKFCGMCGSSRQAYPHDNPNCFDQMQGSTAGVYQVQGSQSQPTVYYEGFRA
eukprot:GFYU01000364.1.p1 GENE.GFYU01000364.1~~GFYU01000364.1.p1  ORF type:complete len:717 (-),score=164.71 GFYU01000364.1:129-2279(-)